MSLHAGIHNTSGLANCFRHAFSLPVFTDCTSRFLPKCTCWYFKNLLTFHALYIDIYICMYTREWTAKKFLSRTEKLPVHLSIVYKQKFSGRYVTYIIGLVTGFTKSKVSVLAYTQLLFRSPTVLAPDGAWCTLPNVAARSTGANHIPALLMVWLRQAIVLL